MKLVKSMRVWRIFGSGVFQDSMNVCITDSEESARKHIKEKYGVEFSEDQTHHKVWSNITDDRDIRLTSENIELI